MQRQNDEVRNLPQNSDHPVDATSGGIGILDLADIGFSEQDIKDFQAVIPTNEDKCVPSKQQLCNAARVIDAIENHYNVPPSEL